MIVHTGTVAIRKDSRDEPQFSPSFAHASPLSRFTKLHIRTGTSGPVANDVCECQSSFNQPSL
jgi:hypothetical protein